MQLKEAGWPDMRESAWLLPVDTDVRYLFPKHISPSPSLSTRLKRSAFGASANFMVHIKCATATAHRVRHCYRVHIVRLTLVQWQLQQHT